MIISIAVLGCGAGGSVSRRAAGQVASILDARGITTTFARLPSGDVEHVVAMGLDPAAARSRHFERDGLGRLLRAIDDGATSSPADDVTVELRWDSLGDRVAEWNNVLGPAGGATHQYDGAGRPVASTLAFLGVQRTFDPLGRLEALQVNGDPAATAQFTYAGLGPPVEREYLSGVATSFSYDPLGRPNGQVDAIGATSLASWRWEMPLDGIPRLAGLRRGTAPEVVSLFEVDRAGRILAEAHDLTGFEALTLSPSLSFDDAASEIGDVAGAGSAWRNYTLDGRHNWLSRAGSDPAQSTTPSSDLLDAYTSFAGSTPVYDDAGSLVQLADETYTYDTFGELTEIQKGAVHRRLIRDALGRVVQEIDVPTGATTTFAHDGLSRAIRRAPDGTIDVTVDGQALDEHLLRVDDAGDRLYYHQDPLGSVYALTNDSGAIAERITYTAFGEPTIQDPLGATLPSSAITNRFAFQGHPFDPATGLVDMRARMYRPTWGRFTTLDPIGLLGGPNLYAFVSAAPLIWRDPLGWGQEGRNNPDLRVPWHDDVSFLSEGCMSTDPGCAAGHGLVSVLQNPPLLKSVHDISANFGFASGSADIGDRDATARAGFAALENLKQLQGEVTLFTSLPSQAARGAVSAFRAARAGTAAATPTTGTAAAAATTGTAAATPATGTAAAGGAGSVALDTNALIAAVERGETAAVLGGRTPIVPITAAKEFLRGGGSADALRAFLGQTGGRIGLAGQEATVASLQQQATALGRVLRTGDARIAAGAMREGVPLVTNDVRFRNFLRAIGFAVEGF